MFIDEYIAEFGVQNNHLQETRASGQEVYHDELYLPIDFSS